MDMVPAAGDEQETEGKIGASERHWGSNPGLWAVLYHRVGAPAPSPTLIDGRNRVDC